MTAFEGYTVASLQDPWYGNVSEASSYDKYVTFSKNCIEQLLSTRY